MAFYKKKKVFLIFFQKDLHGCIFCLIFTNVIRKQTTNHQKPKAMTFQKFNEVGHEFTATFEDGQAVDATIKGESVDFQTFENEIWLEFGAVEINDFPNYADQI